MKKIIIALGFVTLTAMTGSTGANALSTANVAQEKAASTVTPVTYWGDGAYFNDHHHYWHHRHYWKRHYYWHNDHYWHKYHWNRHYDYNYCYYHSYSWYCRHHY